MILLHFTAFVQMKILWHLFTNKSKGIKFYWALSSKLFGCQVHHQMNQLMRLWYLSHRRPATVQTSLRICAVSPKSSLFACMKFGSRWRVRPEIRHLAPLDVCKYLLRTKSTIISPAGSNISANWIYNLCLFKTAITGCISFKSGK